MPLSEYIFDGFMQRMHAAFVSYFFFKNRYLPLTGGIVLTTVYALTCCTVM